MEKGNHDYGEIHIEERRGEKIKSAGYPDVKSFIRDVASGYNAIWQNPNGRLLLAKKNDGEKIAIVELQEHKDRNYYGVTTAFVGDEKYLKRGRRKLLWEGSEPASASPGQLDPLANITPEDTQVDDAWRSGQSLPSDNTIPLQGQNFKGKEAKTDDALKNALTAENIFAKIRSTPDEGSIKQPKNRSSKTKADTGNYAEMKQPDRIGKYKIRKTPSGKYYYVDMGFARPEAETIEELKEIVKGLEPTEEQAQPDKTKFSGPLQAKPLYQVYKNVSERKGWKSVPITDIQKESGMPMDQLKEQLLDESRKGNVVLEAGDWSLASPEERAGVVETKIGTMTQRNLLAKFIKEPQQEISTDTLAQIKNQIGELYDSAIDRKSNKKISVNYKTVDNYEADKIKQNTGLDVEGFARVIDNYSIRHILKGHKDSEKEENRGQIAITKDDVTMIPEIILNADNIVRSKKSKTGLDVIRYEKRVNGFVYIFEEVRTGKNELVPVTLYKKEGAAPRATSQKEGFAHTSETFRNPSENSIPSQEQDFKEPEKLFQAKEDINTQILAAIEKKEAIPGITKKQLIDYGKTQYVTLQTGNSISHMWQKLIASHANKIGYDIISGKTQSPKAVEVEKGKSKSSSKADIGGYADAKPPEAKTEPLEPPVIELPELVAVAAEIGKGKYPAVKQRLRARGGEAIGQYSIADGIQLVSIPYRFNER